MEGMAQQHEVTEKSKIHGPTFVTMAMPN